MAMKPVRRGIKMWGRADSKNSYLSEFDIYTGRLKSDVKQGLRYSVVTRLFQPKKGDWYAKFYNNLFTSLKLVRDLYTDYNILSCKTL